jgi:hypothetical protein
MGLVSTFNFLSYPMLDTVDLKRDLDQLTHRLGKTQDYL